MSNVINISTARANARLHIQQNKRTVSALPVRANREQILDSMLNGSNVRAISHNLDIPADSVRLVLRGKLIIADRFRAAVMQKYPMGARELLAEIEGVVWSRLERETVAPTSGFSTRQVA